MKTHFPPSAIERAMQWQELVSYDPEVMGFGSDRCAFNDACMDEYRTFLDHEYVRFGLVDVDKPMREGSGMFIARHPSKLLIEHAYPAARSGLWWHIAARTYDFEKSLSMYRYMLAHPSMSNRMRNNISEYVERWREMFPGDSRVEEFHDDFVIDMLTRKRVHRRETPTSSNLVVFYDRIT